MIFLITFFHTFPNTPLGRIEQLMAFHQFWDAYQELGRLIQQEGKKAEAKLYRLRAQCAMSMSMSSEAVTDSSYVINLKNVDNNEKQLCYNIRSRSYIQLGKFTEAQSDALLSGDRQVINTAQELSKISLLCDGYLKNFQFSEAIPLLDQIIKVSPHSHKYLLERASIAWNMEDYNKFSELSKNLANIYPEDATLLYRIGIVNFCNGNIDESFKHISNSIKLKKSPKNCSNALNAIKDINKYYPEAQNYIKLNNFQNAENSIEKVFNSGKLFCSENSNLIQAAYVIQSQIIKSKGNNNITLEFLNNMTNKFPENNDFLIERGELNLEIGDYDAALFDFQTAQRRNPNDSRIHNGINKAQQLKKEATTKDYYKILGIKKGSSLEEVKKAYKLKAREWHPDRFGDKEKKKKLN